MSKQEEIREGMIQGVNMILLHNLVTRPRSTNVYANCQDDAKYRKWLENEVDEQLRKPLHSQGVIIKVKCPDCEWGQFKEEAVGMTPCYRCNSTGYITEPLIKEGE